MAMQANNTPRHSGLSVANDAETKPTINFVIVSEDLPRGVLAKHLYDDLVDQMGEELAFTYEVWPYRGLKDPQLRDLAARDAAEADVILFAISGREDLPEEVKTWMQTWLGVSDRPGALVLLSDQNNGSGEYLENIRSYLRERASKAGLEFLANTEAGASEECEDVLIQRITLRESAPLTASNQIPLRFQQRQWGQDE
jgi:hypothetical protein